MTEETKNTLPVSEDMPKWKNRRRTIFGTLFFCAGCILYIMITGEDTRINETIVWGCFGLMMSVIGFYVGGAAWEDISLYKTNHSSQQQSAPRTNV